VDGSWKLLAISLVLTSTIYSKTKIDFPCTIVSVLQLWSTALDSGNSVRALFVDYRKAFDRNDHNVLLNKMIAFGVPKPVIRWLFSFFQDRQQKVKLDSFLSDWARIIEGMHQGSWLGPLIFITYIDDLNPSCVIHKFMDDVTLTEVMSKGSDSANSKMPEHISYLELWSKNNSVNINFEKTQRNVSWQC